MKLLLGDFSRAYEVERRQVQGDNGEDVAMGCLICRRIRYEIRVVAVGGHEIPGGGSETGGVGAGLLLDIINSNVPASRRNVVENAMVHVVGVRSVKILTEQSIGLDIGRVGVCPGKTGQTASVIRICGVLLAQNGTRGANIVGVKFDVALDTSERRAEKDLLAVVIADKGGKFANHSSGVFVNPVPGSVRKLLLLLVGHGSEREVVESSKRVER